MKNVTFLLLGTSLMTFCGLGYDTQRADVGAETFLCRGLGEAGEVNVCFA